jgi:hypothetical protein
MSSFSWRHSSWLRMPPSSSGINVHIGSLRQRIIHPQDFGKTTGLIIMLNNLS